MCSPCAPPHPPLRRLIDADQMDQLWMAIRQDVGTYRTTTRGSWASRCRKWHREAQATMTGKAAQAIPQIPCAEDQDVEDYIKGNCLTMLCNCCDNIVMVLCLCCDCIDNVVQVLWQHCTGVVAMLCLFCERYWLYCHLIFAAQARTPAWGTLCLYAFSEKNWSDIKVMLHTHTHKLCTHNTHKLCTHNTHSQHRDKVFIASVSHLYYRGLTPAYDGDEFSLIQDRYNALLQEAEQAADEPLANDQQKNKKGNRGGNPGKRKARKQPVGVFGSQISGDKSATPSGSATNIRKRGRINCTSTVILQWSSTVRVVVQYKSCE